MNAELFNQIIETGAAVQLSGRTVLRLTGADRVRYLNGQATNDIRKTTAIEATYALITDHKAHILADIFVHADPSGQALLVDAEGDLRESLAARLERYIIADDVELSDETEPYSIWHVFGAAAEAFVSHPHAVRCERLGRRGIDLWLPASEKEPMFSCPVISCDDYEVLRIIWGIPRHPAELNDTTFPAEAGLEKRAVSFSKGCYIGQEVVSRIQSTRKMPRTLVTWVSQEQDRPVVVGTVLSTPEEPEKTMGAITSTTLHPVTGFACGLAYIKQGTGGPDSTLLARVEPPTLAASIKINAIPA